MSVKKLQIVSGAVLQSNWNETDPLKPQYIQNKPNIPSDFTGNFNDLIDIPDLQKKSFVKMVELAHGVWEGEGPYYQIVSLDGVTANSKVDMQADADTMAAILSGGYCLSAKNDNGVVTIYSIGAKPIVNLKLQLNVVEVSKETSSDVVWGSPLMGSSGGFAISTSEPVNTNALWLDITSGLKYYDGTSWVVIPVAYA